MTSRFHHWWENVPIADPLKRQQARFFQMVLVVWIMLVTIGLPLLFFRNTGSAEAPPPVLPADPFIQLLFVMLLFATPMLWLSPVISLVLLRRGKFDSAVLMAACGLLLGHSVAAIALGVNDASVLIVFQIPIALAGLLGGRRLLVAISSYTLILVFVIGILQSHTQYAAVFYPPVENPMGGMIAPILWQPIGFFVVITLLISLLLDRVGSALRNALYQSQQREAELEAIRNSLEITIRERTAELENRNTDLERLLDLVNVLETPTIAVADGVLLAPIVGALDSGRAQRFTIHLLKEVSAQRTRQVILDIAGVKVVDTHVAQALVRTAQALSLLGCQVTITGISATVATTLTHLGVNLGSIVTARSPQDVLVRVDTSN